jgi:DNA-binding GntR family transcriptional regulator
VRGSGTFVARRIHYRMSTEMPPSWSETVRRAGGEPHRRILGVGRVPAPLHVRRALELRPRARVVAITRLGTVDGLVADLGTSWVPTDLVDDLDGFLPDGGSLYQALVARGLRPRRRRTSAQLEAVPPEAAPQLELEGRPLVWRIQGCNEDELSGRPIELHDGWMRPDVYRVALELGGRP